MKRKREQYPVKRVSRREGGRARAREGRCPGRARETGKRETAEMLLTLLEHI